MRFISMFTLPFLLLSGISVPDLKVHQNEVTAKDEYLSWSPQQVRDIVKAMRASGKVGGRQGLLNTDRAINYKLRATWLTPEVIWASARMLQINGRLSDEQTRALVAEAAAAGPTVVLVDQAARKTLCESVHPPDQETILKYLEVAHRGLSGYVRSGRNLGQVEILACTVFSRLGRR